MSASCNTSDMPSSRSEETELREAVQYAVIQLCEEEGCSTTTFTRLSPRALTALAELTTLYATTSLAADLEAFSTHAGRKTITEADVKLVARKSPMLLEHLDAVGKQSNDNNASTLAPGRKTTPKVDSSKSQKKAEEVCQDDSSSSSSDDDILALDTIEGQRKKTAAAVRSAMEASETGRQTLTIPLHPMRITCLPNHPRRRRPTDTAKMAARVWTIRVMMTTTTGRPQKVSKKTEPERRFRLQPSNQDDSLNNDSSSEDGVLTSPFHQRDTKPSKTQQMLANLSQDSLLSVDGRQPREPAR